MSRSKKITPTPAKPKKRINSRAKGASAERELANLLTSYGYPARRGQQFSGGSDSPDVVCETLNAYHIECKRTKATDIYGWLAQAKRDGKDKVPLVAHRKDNQDWVVILPLSDFLMVASGLV